MIVRPLGRQAPKWVRRQGSKGTRVLRGIRIEEQSATAISKRCGDPVADLR